jgi:hypothetical protein
MWSVLVRSRGTDDLQRLMSELDVGTLIPDPADSTLARLPVRAGDPAEAWAEGGEAIARLNGFGKLRWGQVFDRIEPTELQRCRSGVIEHQLFARPATVHVPPSDFVSMLASQGLTAPQEPTHFDRVTPVPGAAAIKLANADLSVQKALRLLAAALPSGVDRVDWVLLYCVFDVIDADLGRRGRLKKSGLCDASQLSDFTWTANSESALGDRARHGTQRNTPPTRPMTDQAAAGFIRGLVAEWITRKLSQPAPSAGP